MGTDQLIILLSQVCSYLLPVAAFILLIFLIVFIYHLIKVMKKLNQTLGSATVMVEECDKQLKKLDGPLATVNDLSKTVDDVHDATKKALTSTIAIIMNNLGNIKEKFSKETGLNDAVKEREADNNG